MTAPGVPHGHPRQSCAVRTATDAAGTPEEVVRTPTDAAGTADEVVRTATDAVGAAE
jgi:hypothetical protein